MFLCKIIESCSKVDKFVKKLFTLGTRILQDHCPETWNRMSEMGQKGYAGKIFPTNKVKALHVPKSYIDADEPFSE